MSNINTTLINDFYWGDQNAEEYACNLNKKSKKRKTSNDDDDHNHNKKTKDNISVYSSGNEVHFTAGINKYTIELLIIHITDIINKQYEKHEHTDTELCITYIVDSPGGSVVSVLKFVDFINLTKHKYPNIKFKSIISGLAASAGTIMACVADERIMTAYATSMIHDLSGGNYGTYTQMISHVDFLKCLNNMLIDIYAKNCKKTKDELVELLKTNKWFSPQEYLEYGFVDKII
jgi:ATP-dependent protease ClpP protease subunit